MKKRKLEKWIEEKRREEEIYTYVIVIEEEESVCTVRNRWKEGCTYWMALQTVIFFLVFYFWFMDFNFFLC